MFGIICTIVNSCIIEFQYYFVVLAEKLS